MRLGPRTGGRWRHRIPYRLTRISSSSRQTRFHWPLVYLGVALTTLAALLLELSLTRIFSVVFHYHFAFLAISIALFGLGAGGVFSYVVSGWRWSLYSKLGTLALLNSLVVVVSLVLALSIREMPLFWALAAVYFPSTLPFFVAGAVVSLAISETIERVDRVYFYDLIGAGAGCLLLIPLLNNFGGPNTVIAAAVCFAASAAIWFSLSGTVRWRVASVALSLALLLLFGYNARNRIIDVKYAKGKTLAGEQFVKWNSFSRIALAPEKVSRALTIFIDADASTAIAKFDLEHLREEDRRGLLHQGPGFPYVMRPGAKTLIIGPGGGWDVARALASGSRDVTGVEINPIIANTIMRERFPGYSSGLYLRPEVRICVEDGRSFIRRSREQYQVIQATLVDTWASTAAGAYALSENNLYTTDAFRDYLRHLTPDGMLAFTRWGLEPPRESLRLLSLAAAALSSLGEREPWRHIIVAREGSLADSNGWGALDNVLVSRKPFSAGDLDRARAAMREARLTAIYMPDENIPNAFTELLRTAHRREFEKRYPYDIRPVDDNRPFFFYTVQPRDLWSFLRHFVEGGQPKSSRADFQVNMAVPVMFGLLAVSLTATLIVLALPPLLLGARLPLDKSARKFLLYFIAIGAGYIMIEIALIQRFVLFLGHPTYALTVIIFSMLIASGCGSFWSRRFVGVSGIRLRALLAMVALLVSALAILVTPLTEAGVGWPLFLKVALTAAMVSVPGFLMGMPFPTGLSLLEARHKPSVRWAWALNAASSVLGSVGAIFLAIYFGLRETLLAGGAMYVVALVILQVTAADRDIGRESNQPHFAHPPA
nr:hypothetical protein [uncultured bacterium]